jgi:hypothetical protein
MSGLNLVAVQDIITSHIKSEFPGYIIYEDDVLNDEMLLRIGNKVKPYIVLRWGSLGRNTAATSFAGVRHDEYNSSVDICVVAPTGSQARRGLNIVYDRLIGWKPTGGGAMTPFGGSGLYVVDDRAGAPHVYVATSRLEFAMNSENVGAYIAP